MELQLFQQWCVLICVCGLSVCSPIAVLHLLSFLMVARYDLIKGSDCVTMYCNLFSLLNMLHHSYIILYKGLCFCLSLFFLIFFFWGPESDVFVALLLMCVVVSIMRLQPPTQNMPMGPGGMNQSGPPPQPPHGHNMPSEGMVSGGPPAPHMQNQMNGQMPGKWPSPLPVNIPPSSLSFFLYPSSPSVPVSLLLPSNTIELWGRSAERWCHPLASSGGLGLLFIMAIPFSKCYTLFYLFFI